MPEPRMADESGPRPGETPSAVRRRLVPDLFAIFVYVLALGTIAAQFVLIAWLSLT